MANQLTGALQGRRAIVQFPEATARVEYTTNNKLIWQITHKDGRVTNGKEHFGYMQLSDTLHFLNWQEKTGFTVSQVIDAEAGTVRAMWSYPDKGRHKKIMPVNGSFAFT